MIASVKTKFNLTATNLISLIKFSIDNESIADKSSTSQVSSAMATHEDADLLCGILESKAAYFVEHPVVQEEVDSAAGRRLLPRRALDAEAVLGTHVITPKAHHKLSPSSHSRSHEKWGLALGFNDGAIAEEILRTFQNVKRDFFFYLLLLLLRARTQVPGSQLRGRESGEV